MTKPHPAESDAPETGPVPRTEQERSAGNSPPPGRHDPDAASALADDLKNPLAIVIANLQLLAELVTSVQAEVTREGEPRPDAADWLTTRMAEAENCVSDTQAAAERIREIVAPTKALRQGASDRPPPPKKDALRPARIMIVDDE